jgi:heme/copper-type cytochrome/quinol oxidase subunit 2
MLGTVTFAAGFLPAELEGILNLLGPSGICASDYITARARLALFMVLGGLVLISVVYALLAAFKYIRSEGDPGKMEEAQKSIKAIFFGIAAMIIAILGIVLVFVIFGAKQTNPQLFQTCINASDSVGCKKCVISVDDPTCKTCEDSYAKICTKYAGQSKNFSDIIGELPEECKPTNLK